MLVPRVLLLLAGALLALAVGGCASVTSSPGGLPGAPGVEPGAAPRGPGQTPLAMEQRFLEDWFRGTPVVITSQPPTTLQLDVPLANSFAPGRAEVRPALNAVLDRTAQSLQRHPGARITVTAPGDADGPSALARSRTLSVRDALGRKGVAATRVSLIESERGGTPVQLRLALPTVSSQSVARRGPASAPRVSSGVQPVSTRRTAPPTWIEPKR